MKTKLLFAIAFAFACRNVNAQIYFPFPTSASNATWSVEHWYYNTFGNPVITGTTFYGTMGDTIISGNSYVKIYECGTPWTNDTAFNPATAIFSLWVFRESNKQIFMRMVNDTADKLHYDFNLALGNSFYFYYAPMMGFHDVTDVDSVLVNGSYRHTLTFDGTDTWIEGIGSDAGLFESNMLIGNIYTLLLCYSENGNILYSPYGDCERFTGINENEINRFIKVYPNPVLDILKIENGKSGATIEIENLLRATILKQKLTSEKSQLDLEFLPGGTYILHYIENSEASVFKLVKY